MKIEKYVCDGCHAETATSVKHDFWLTFEQIKEGASIRLSGSTATVELFRGGRTRLDFCSLKCFESYLRLYAKEAGCAAVLDASLARWAMMDALKGTDDGRNE